MIGVIVLCGYSRRGFVEFAGPKGENVFVFGQGFGYSKGPLKGLIKGFSVYPIWRLTDQDHGYCKGRKEKIEGQKTGRAERWVLKNTYGHKAERLIHPMHAE